MFHSWGAFAYRHRRTLPIIILLIIIAAYALCGAKLGERVSQEGWDDPHSSSTKAAAIEEQIFGRSNNGDIILLFSGDANTITNNEQVSASLEQQIENLKTEYPDQVDAFTSYFDRHNQQLVKVKDDGTAVAFASVGLQGTADAVLKNFRVIENSLHNISAPGVTVEVAGSTAIADALDDGMTGDIHRAELYGLPAVAVLLLLVFGSVVAACMPLIVGILSILGSLAVLSFLALFTQVNTFGQSVVTLLGLGLAIDYGLFMVSRFREELAAGTPTDKAVAITTATAGKTVVFSASMVAVSLSGLLIFPQAFLKSVAYGAISAVVLAAILSITVLPSIFGLLGKRIDTWTIRRRSFAEKDIDQSAWARIPAWAMRHSKLLTVAIVAVLFILCLPTAGIKFGGINETYLPPNNSARVAQAKFDENFPNFRTSPVTLVIQGADSRQLASIYQEANAIPGLTGRFGVSRPTTDGTTILSAGIQNRSDYTNVVHRLENLNKPDGVTIYVGGTPALEVESIAALFGKLPWMALYVVLATFILMSLVFGSMILPAKAIIMTILGIGSTLGILTLLFVDGFGAHLFNFTAGPLMSPILVLIVAIVYGLSTDYEVFLLSRMVESKETGHSTDQSIRYGTAHTGSIITAAALIMIVVCGAFGFSEIVMMKYIAFGMIVALLLDATVIRMLLVPAVMHLLREDSWWAPAWVKKASQFMGHGNGAGATMPAQSVPATQGALPTQSAVAESEDKNIQDNAPAPSHEVRPKGISLSDLRSRLARENPESEQNG
ncbi:MAG: MMPL family transporter [Corynebacterium sp.]|nr:MMPL family transporter [Corynebacterium sp.]